MDPPSGKASEFERRVSIRRSVRLSVAGDDDGDLAGLAVADGFAPVETNISSTLQVPNPDGSPRQRTVASRPSSIAKPPLPVHDPISTSSDGSGTSTAPTTGVPTSPATTATTEAAIVQAESPYQGPSGPSHPYGLYPQRTLSVTIIPTAAVPEHAYNGPRGPAHPYALYNQTTLPTDGPSSQGFITLGFGRQDNYQRQIGPDGEAGDLVGPLGHTEELPPYSRYPDEAYARKTTEADQPAAEPEAGAVVIPTLPTPIHQIPGAGGIGLATRDPAFASTEDLDSPRSRLSTRSFTSDASQHEINTAARTIAEKPEQRKWQKRAKKRLWGIVPYWAICLLAMALIAMGIVLGAVVGTWFSRRGRPQSQHDPE